jgi:ribonuclease HI
MSSLRKSEILESFSKHLSAEKLLEEHPGLDRETISRLLIEAAEAVGPGMVELARPRPKPKAVGAGARLKLFTDGASRGNPGEAGVGVLVEDESGHILKRHARYLGKATNNQAEYEALLDGIDIALSLGVQELSIFADSELLVKQLSGEYRVKNPDLQVKFARAKSMLSGVKSVIIRHIPREKNKEADALANEAIDKKLI